MTTTRAILTLFVCVVTPPAAGIIGFQVAHAAGSIVGFILGCIPAVLLWRGTPRTGYPTEDVGDAGFWVSGSAPDHHDAVDSGGWEGGGGDSGGGGADGGGGD